MSDTFKDLKISIQGKCKIQNKSMDLKTIDHENI